MRKIILTLLMISLLLPLTGESANAAIVSNRSYRAEQRQINKENIRQIKALFDQHTKFANQHDSKNLEPLYADNYMNNDGFNKEVYFKSIKSTWESCEDLSYSTKILSINVNGDNASVDVEETANGTIRETIESVPVSGEIHSISKSIYQLVKINGKWYISGETALTDESSLLYGDARFMNIEIQSPTQVASGETYTVTLKIDADKDTFIVGSIDSDPVVYPTKAPKSELRAIPQSQVLERLIKANTNNINEYAVASMAISKVKNAGESNFRVYMSGLACVMRRINVIPKNNFVKTEE